MTTRQRHERRRKNGKKQRPLNTLRVMTTINVGVRFQKEGIKPLKTTRAVVMRINDARRRINETKTRPQYTLTVMRMKNVGKRIQKAGKKRLKTTKPVVMRTNVGVRFQREGINTLKTRRAVVMRISPTQVTNPHQSLNRKGQKVALRLKT